VRRVLVLSALLGLAPASAQTPVDEPYLTNVRHLTRDDSRAGEAYFSPDGKRVLFQAIRPEHPHYQIYVMNVDGSGRRLVSTGKGKTTCAFFHPTDPDLFIYASSHLDERTHAPPPPGSERRYRWDYEGSFDIFLARLSTGELVKRLTTADGYDAECAFSKDARRICFTSQRHGADSDIWLMNADGSEQRPLVKVPGTDGGPFFSPDDRWVLYRASRTPGNDEVMQVFLTSVDGQETRQLTDQARVNWAPTARSSCGPRRAAARRRRS
jgi:Tol biopolymer transport system component